MAPINRDQELSDRWCRLATCSTSDLEAVQVCFQEITEAYSQPQRRYHTVTHLAHVFALLDEAGATRPVCQWATWFHDVVYRAGSSRNEARSARYAKKAMVRLGVGADELEAVAQAILATKDHAPQDTEECNLFLDADMAILGSGTDEYEAYVGLIRDEYAGIPLGRFHAGRIRFIRELLSRSEIFHTEFFRNRYEDAARRNLRRELDILSGK